MTIATVQTGSRAEVAGRYGSMARGRKRALLVVFFLILSSSSS